MLDSVIADAALPLWEVGKYRQAVNDAATSLNQFAQAQLGRRDISDRKLMAEALSDAPPKPGEPRLRCYPARRATRVRARSPITGLASKAVTSAPRATRSWV